MPVCLLFFITLDLVQPNVFPQNILIFNEICQRIQLIYLAYIATQQFCKKLVKPLKIVVFGHNLPKKGSEVFYRIYIRRTQASMKLFTLSKQHMFWLSCESCWIFFTKKRSFPAETALILLPRSTNKRLGIKLSIKKKKNFCLMLTVDARLLNVPPSFDLNGILMPCLKRNDTSKTTEK